MNRTVRTFQEVSRQGRLFCYTSHIKTENIQCIQDSERKKKKKAQEHGYHHHMGKKLRKESISLPPECYCRRITTGVCGTRLTLYERFLAFCFAAIEVKNAKKLLNQPPRTSWGMPLLYSAYTQPGAGCSGHYSLQHYRSCSTTREAYSTLAL